MGAANVPADRFLKAQEQGLAQRSRTKVQLMEDAAERIRQVRETVRLVMTEGGILPPPG